VYQHRLANREKEKTNYLTATVAQQAETTSTSVATTLALAEQVVAKHLDKGI
jgi:hypothetical protein